MKRQHRDTLSVLPFLLSACFVLIGYPLSLRCSSQSLFEGNWFSTTNCTPQSETLYDECNHYRYKVILPSGFDIACLPLTTLVMDPVKLFHSWSQCHSTNWAAKISKIVKVFIRPASLIVHSDYQERTKYKSKKKEKQWLTDCKDLHQPVMLKIFLRVFKGTLCFLTIFLMLLQMETCPGETPETLDFGSKALHFLNYEFTEAASSCSLGILVFSMLAVLMLQSNDNDSSPNLSYRPHSCYY